jgi:hypothetical protein
VIAFKQSSFGLLDPGAFFGSDLTRELRHTAKTEKPIPKRVSHETGMEGHVLI